MDQLRDLAADLRIEPSALLDIFLTAVLIYLVLRLIQGTRAVRLAIGAAIVLAVCMLMPETGAVLAGAEGRGTVVPIGRALLTTHLFAFEFITLVLVAAIVGAVYLGKKEPR